MASSTPGSSEVDDEDLGLELAMAPERDVAAL